MTTMVAVQGQNWTAVACDSQVTEDNRVFMLPKENPKIVKNGSYLLGAAGDMRAVNLLAHEFKPPTPPANCTGVKLDKFISNKFIPDLKACFDDAQYGEKGSQDSTILVVVHGTVYEIGSGYDWCHDVSGIYAFGSGGDFALGALHAELEGKKLTLPAVRAAVKHALEIASRLDSNTGGQVVFQVQTWAAPGSVTSK
jgi:ATP-dependent protease HslVU (ClpYQ) peptidase subunit